jgi:16S rRNA (cytosine967-C5)-methyltransferase
LADRWAKYYGQEEMKSLVHASLQVPPTTLRAGDGEVGREAIQKQLTEDGIATRVGKCSRHALVVETGNIQASRIWRDGRAVIQDEASQLVASLISPRSGDRILDLCAAPGIKTGQLAMALGSGLVVGCDLSARRLRTMQSLFPRTIPTGVRVLPVRLDAAKPSCFGIEFDRILVDAPCSGTGTLARNPEIKWRLQPKDLARLAELQAKILSSALKALAPGGRLVYATCSLEMEENEQVIEAVLRLNDKVQLLPPSTLALEFPSLASLFDSRGFFHTRPDLHGMDGFFAAVIQRFPL